VHARVADFVNALAGSKRLMVDLGGQDRYFVIVEQSKERDVFELDGVAGHGSPHRR
jgi:hypothetical protein